MAGSHRVMSYPWNFHVSKRSKMSGFREGHALQGLDLLDLAILLQCCDTHERGSCVHYQLIVERPNWQKLRGVIRHPTEVTVFLPSSGGLAMAIMLTFLKSQRDRHERSIL